jgi:hypothetical protein
MAKQNDNQKGAGRKDSVPVKGGKDIKSSAPAAAKGKK